MKNVQNGNVGIILLVIVVLIVGGWYLYKSNPKETSDSEVNSVTTQPEHTLLPSNARTDEDWEIIANQRDTYNRPIVESATVTAENLDRYDVLKSVAINSNLTAKLLINNLEYCTNQKDENVELYCDRDIVYVVVFNKQSNKNIYLKSYQMSLDGAFSIEYLPVEKQLRISHGAVTPNTSQGRLINISYLLAS